MTRRIAAGALRERLARGGGEFALLDVREEGVFARGHLLTASSLPLSRLELRIAALLPRRSTPIILCDDGDGLAERAAARLRDFGYGDLAVVDGGVAAMAAAGAVLFEGIYVPSKAFGEYVEHRWDTPRITAGELDALRRAGTDMVILDSRPWPEYRRMCIPGGIDVPGAELVHRVADLAPSPDRLVVVNCAGRTRSIIGAQSLINAGTPNRVVALENGTMGWALAGFEVETGQSRRPPSPSTEARTWARAAAARVAERFGVRSIDRATLGRWRAEAAERTLYLFDVRLPEEYEAGHLPGARNAQGGQLVQSTDAYVGTRGSRIVLVDDDGVRATMTASWLIQMAWEEVYVLEGGLDGALETGPDRDAVLGLADTRPATISPAALSELLEADDVAVVDLATSRAYGAGHIPGAWFAIRSRMASSFGRMPAAARIVLTSPDGVLARLAAAEAEAASGLPVAVLDGGTDTWRAAGLEVESGFTRMLDPRDDVYILPYEHETGVEEAMRAYLSWETALVPQVERDGSLRFPEFPPPQDLGRG